jgi:hypothetical protein
MKENDIEIGVDLTDEERELLARGVIEWGGPARCTEELARAMGFASVADLFLRSDELIDAIRSKAPLTPRDWTRVLLLTEIVFASDVVGSGRDWPTTTGLSDAESLLLLRSVQRKIRRREQLGTRPPKRWRHKQRAFRMSNAPDSPLMRAHKHSANHRAEIEASARCGCFYCIETYEPSAIEDWIDDVGGVGTTAQCPRCGIDSVIGDASGFPISEKFLREMHEHWFGQ